MRPHANKLKHETRHRHQLEHKTKTTPHYIAKAIAASEISDLPLDEAVRTLHAECLQTGLMRKLFPFPDRPERQKNSVPLDIDKPAPDQIAREQAISSTEEFSLIAELGIEKNVARLRSRLGKRFTPEQVAAYLAACKRESSDKADDKPSPKQDKAHLGQLLVPLQSLSRQLGLDLPALNELRELVALHAYPRFIGYRSPYEYRLWITRHVLLPEQPLPDDGLLHQSRSWLLRQAGYSRPALTVLYRLLEGQLEAHSGQGKSPRPPRSAARLAKLFDCSLETAKTVIRLYRELPDSLASDCSEDSASGRKRLRKSPRPALYPPEFQLVETDGGFRVEWTRHALESFSLFQGERTIQLIEGIRKLVKKHSAEVVETLFNDITTDLTKLSWEDIEREADAFLLAHGERQLARITAGEARQPVPQSRGDSLDIDDDGLPADLEPNPAHHEGYLRKTNTTRNRQLASARILRTLDNLAVRYQSLVESIEMKPVMVQFIVDQQSDYLRSGDVCDLHKLSKSDVVRGLGLLASGDPCETPDEHRRRYRARKLERYMRNIRLRLPDGRVIALEELIPGHAGIVDMAGQHVLDRVIKQWIRDLIAEEPRDKPLSDQKIAERLARDYALPIKRSLVKRYRLALGIGSSQQRRYHRDD